MTTSFALWNAKERDLAWARAENVTLIHLVEPVFNMTGVLVYISNENENDCNPCVEEIFSIMGLKVPIAAKV